ncbi:MFS transporter [Roseomonas sp. SSH11]|uniref:MFS transporter n=1 Tax=Pararoseomonas baculiformis TaxID=2820812 RepID=A0ABS4AMP1_9PROT|nr:MFS transporter [Pararoseomonas baculiformis]MBP0447504.1 MFS transporter [Pararoseomonas baculiformis]
MQTHWQALAVLTMARISLGFQVQSIASVSPDLVAELALSYADLGTLLGLYYLPGIVLAFPGAALGRRFGDKRVVICGLFLMALGGLMTAAAWDFASLLVGRLLSGVGAIVLNVLMSKMITDWFAGRREIVLAMAVFVNSLPIGMGLAMLALSPLAILAGWSAALAATAAASLAALLLVHLAYTKHHNDSAGTEAAGRISASDVLLMCLAGAIWGIFNGSVAVMMGFAPTFLTYEGHSAAQIALLVGATIWLSAASVQAGGVLAQRWGKHTLLMAAGALGWGACLALLASGVGLSSAALIGAGLVLGLPVGVILAMPSQVLRPESRSVGMGLFYTCLYLGNTMLPPAAGWVQDLTGRPAAPLHLTAMLVASMLLLYALFHAVARRRVPG